MKRREMNSLAGRADLGSRNNDIAGYWGIGMLCAASKREGKPKFSFKIYPRPSCSGSYRIRSHRLQCGHGQARHVR